MSLTQHEPLLSKEFFKDWDKDEYVLRCDKFERDDLINRYYIVYKLHDFLTGSIHGETVQELLKKDNLLWSALQKYITPQTLQEKGN